MDVFFNRASTYPWEQTAPLIADLLRHTGTYPEKRKEASPIL